MKKYLSILFFSFLFIQNATSQEGVIYLENPSFEGTPVIGEHGSELPKGWMNCGFENETPPDVHLVEGNPFGVETPSFHGRSYLGLVVRENHTWERVSQHLTSPMQAGVEYSFNIYLARSIFYSSASRTSNGQMFNYNTPCKLRIWGGHGSIRGHEILAESGLVKKSDWEEYKFSLTPSKNYNYLILEAFYETPSTPPYNGNLLIDLASDLVPVGSFQVDSSRVALIDSLNKNLLYFEQQPIETLESEEKESIVITSNLTRFEFTEPHMSTEFKIVLYAESDSLAGLVSSKAFDRIAVLGKIFNYDREDSEITHLLELAGTNKRTQASPDLWEVLLRAQRITDRSNGAYDFTAGALTSLWEQAFQQKKMPSESEIKKALQTVGQENVTFGSNQEIQIHEPGLHFDIGRIAIGYAMDEALKTLKSSGFSITLIKTDRAIAVGDPPPGETGWKVERPIYRAKGLTSITSTLANQAIATYGIPYSYLTQDGKRYSNIIDSRTGYGISKRRIVSVVAPTCAEADGWASALSVDVSKKALSKIKRNGGKGFVSEF